MTNSERVNVITHLLGAVAALAGLIVLVVIASLKGDVWKIVSFSVYGATLFLLYAASVLYHASNGKLKKFFRMIDHQAIYLLIAGTYTPFTLVTLRGAWGWSLFGVLWGLALIGMIYDAFKPKKRIIPMFIYFIMGWLIVVALEPLLKNLPMDGFLWLLSGGLFYTVGIVFFALSDKYQYAHGVWHLFVLGGSTCHYVAILDYIA